MKVSIFVILISSIVLGLVFFTILIDPLERDTVKINKVYFNDMAKIVKPKFDILSENRTEEGYIDFLNVMCRTYDKFVPKLESTSLQTTTAKHYYDLLLNESIRKTKKCTQFKQSYDIGILLNDPEVESLFLLESETLNELREYNKNEKRRLKGTIIDNYYIIPIFIFLQISILMYRRISFGRFRKIDSNFFILITTFSIVGIIGLGAIYLLTLLLGIAGMFYYKFSIEKPL